MSSDKAVLEATLGQLLGFDDGATDVLDHLLTIESREDLLEYLTQLLGDATPTIRAFVDNVQRFKSGEPLMASSKTVGDTSAQTTDSKSKPHEPLPQQPSSKLTPLQSASNPKKKNEPRSPPPQAKKNQSQCKTGAATTKNVTKKANPSSGGTRQATKQPQPNSAGASATKNANPTPAGRTEPPAPRKVEKSRPTRGKAKKVCGCFGTFHTPLTNCLYCGRISCSEEGYDHCPFCGYMVEEVIADGSVDTNDPSWKQKERLLRFDREFAKRTEIFDDQADFQGPSTWMTAEERAQAEENERNQLESLKRPKQVLDLAL